MGNKIQLTVAEALVKFLNQQYYFVDGKTEPFVKGVFHIFGHGNVLGIGEVLSREPGHLEIYQGKNEQGMAQAAIAYAKETLRRQIFAVTTSVGPGAANLVTAAGTALANNLPVLFLPGDTFATRQPDPVLQQIEQETSHSITTNDALKPVSRYWDRVNRPEQLMTALIKGFEVLTDPVRSGPVTIAIPQDVAGESYAFPEEFFSKRIHYFDRRTPTEREVETAAQLIKQSSFPVLLVGGGAKYSGASEIIERISERHCIPVVETQAGKSTLTSDWQNNLGGAGVTGTLSANKGLKQADLIIGVGTRYTDFTTSSKTAFSSKTTFLNINVSRTQSYKLDGHAVVADAKAALEKIADRLDSYHTGLEMTISELKREWLQERNRLSQIDFTNESVKPEIKGHMTQEDFAKFEEALDTRLAQTTALIELNRLLADNSIVVAAAGSLPGDMERLWESKQKNTYNMEYGYSTMGYEVAGAFGAKIAHPDKEVYALLGDGSFNMLHSELISSIQYGKKINLLLFDNAGFGCINNLQMANGGLNFGTELTKTDGSVMALDFAKVAEGYGAVSYTVNTIEQLQEAFADSLKQDVSTVIHIKVLPKTMTDGYESWWNVGVNTRPENKHTAPYYLDKQKKLNKARQY